MDLGSFVEGELTIANYECASSLLGRDERGLVKNCLGGKLGQKGRLIPSSQGEGELGIEILRGVSLKKGL